MNLLLTQCVQRDFVRPLAEREPLPKLVHVGRLVWLAREVGELRK